jgi:WD40 repeat protein
VREAKITGVKNAPLKELHQFLTRYTNVLSEHPQELLAQLLSARRQFVSAASLELIKSMMKRKKGKWLRPLPNQTSSQTLLRTIEYESQISPSAFPAKPMPGDSRIWSLESYSKGQKVIAAHHDHRIRIWDIRTGKVEAELLGHNAEVNCLALSINEEKFISAASDGSLIVWSAISFEKLKEMKAKKGINCLATHPSLPLVAAGESTGVIRIWNFKTGRPVKPLLINRDLAWQIKFSPCGKFLYSVSQNGELISFHSETGKMLKKIKSDLFRSIDVSKDGKLLIVGDGGGKIIIVNTEKFEIIAEWRAHAQVIRGVAFCPIPGKVISVSADGLVKIWNLKNRKLDQKFADHATPVNALNVSKNSRYVCTGDENGRIFIWDMHMAEAGNKRLFHTARVMKIISNRRHLISASSDGNIVIWDKKKGELLYSKKLNINTYDFDFLGNILGHSKTHYIIALSHNALFTLNMKSNRIKRRSTGNIECFSTDIYLANAGTSVISITGDSRLTWRSFPDLNIYKERKLKDSRIINFIMTPDRLKAAIKYDGNVNHKYSVIDVSEVNGREIEIERKLRQSRQIEFLNNRIGLSHLRDGSVCIWSLESGKITKHFRAGSRIVSFLISKDSHRIITALDDGNLYAWDYISGKHTHLGIVEDLKINSMLEIQNTSLLLLLANNRYSLNLYDYKNQDLVGSFSTNSQITECEYFVESGLIVLGESSGKLHFLNVKEEAAS